jgi:hypothetical protein
VTVTDAQRLVTKDEQALVSWLVQHAGRAAASPLLATVPDLRVVDRCDCGCPSLDFVREGMGAGAQILADAEGTADDGLSFSVILWGRDQQISGLEIFSYDGGPWFPLPRPESLRRSLPFDSL